MKEEISFEEFLNVDIRIGTVIEIKDFPKAHKAAYQLTMALTCLWSNSSLEYKSVI